MVEEKDIEENPADIMTNNTSEADFARHMRRITEGELWELVDTGKENFNNTEVTNAVITHDNI